MPRRRQGQVDAAVLPFASKPRATQVQSGTTLGWLVAWSSDEGAVVDYPDNTHGPRPALSIIVIDSQLAGAAIALRRQVLLALGSGHRQPPVIVGMIEPPVKELPPSAANLDATVDGKRVQLTAEEEIVLKCGDASIVLRRNGRIVIRGTYVETRSRGVNRIRGGSVQIN